MARSNILNANVLVVSANNQQTDMGTAQTLDTAMLIEETVLPDITPLRELNLGETTGQEEATKTFTRGYRSSVPISYMRAQPQHIAFGLAYALGSCSVAGSGTGYAHTITPLATRTPPFFTAGFAYDNVMKRRFTGMVIDSLSLSMQEDDWCKLNLTCPGSGNYTDNVISETVTANFNAVSLTLAANAVQGSTAAARLDNVHYIRVVDPTSGNSEYLEVSFSAVSAATPAVITISAPGGVATSTTYEVVYKAAAAAWETFPAEVVETPLIVSDVSVNVGGFWDGSTFTGGKTMSSDVIGIEYNINNSTDIRQRQGNTGDYANFAFRNQREQTLKINREFTDARFIRMFEANEYFGIKITLTGAEFATGENYSVVSTFPRCTMLSSPLSANGKRIAEAGDIRILYDATAGVATSCNHVVTNEVAGSYAQ